MTWAAFARTAYQAAREWGIQPSEFRRLRVSDWWAEWQAKAGAAVRVRKMQEEQRGRAGGKVRPTKAHFEQARALLREMEAERA